MLKKLFGKAVSGFMGKEVHGRIKGNEHKYSLSFEDTKLPWKETTKLGSWSIFGEANSTSGFSWDKKFISSEFDGKTSALLLVGVLNLNHSTVNILLDHMKEGGKGDSKEIENTEAILKMLRLGKLFQETVQKETKFDDLFKNMESPMDDFFKIFWPEKDENTKRISLNSHHENFYGLESWAKISRGIGGDEWIYNMYIPAGGVIYLVRAMALFEKLKDEVKTEIEQIAHSFRFDMIPIAIDELSKVADELEAKKEND